jgi:hypothetical protein
MCCPRAPRSGRYAPDLTPLRSLSLPRYASTWHPPLWGPPLHRSRLKWGRRPPAKSPLPHAVSSLPALTHQQPPPRLHLRPQNPKAAADRRRRNTAVSVRPRRPQPTRCHPEAPRVLPGYTWPPYRCHRATSERATARAASAPGTSALPRATRAIFPAGPSRQAPASWLFRPAGRGRPPCLVGSSHGLDSAHALLNLFSFSVLVK